LAINPVTPSTLYAGCFNGGVNKSTDAGGHWAAANTGLVNAFGYQYVHNLAIDPVTPATLYAGTGNPCCVYKSIDSADNWATANTGLSDYMIFALAINPTTPSTLYASGEFTGIHKSTDSGSTWVATANTGLPNGWVPSAYAFSTPATLFAGFQYVTQGGVFKSIDSGSTWAAASTGLPGYPVRALAIDPTATTTLYAGLTGGSVWQLTFGSAPAISTITPASGTTAGGIAVTITGTNFAFGSSVTIGGTAATSVVSSTQITATTPAHAAGAVNVVVTNPDAQSATLASGFTYVASSSSGDANGDGQVTIADVFYLINYLFAGGPGGVAGDANGDGSVTVGDVFYLINYLFAGGPAPV
jgi:IPT/TIG domain/Dockerin type I domain